MYNVVQILVRFGAPLLFVVLEVFCFYLIINYNQDKKDIFINSSAYYAGRIAEQSIKIGQYIDLQQQNDSLLRENATLIENLISIEYSSDKIPEPDTMYTGYGIIPAHICNSTIHLRNNHYTLCKGYREGIRPDMGVISANEGIVGIVRNVSENYAHVISILHSQTRISCGIKRRSGHGSLVWNGLDPQRMSLIAIPKHETVIVGDTVMTSGYSTIFPKGILVGKVEKVEKSAGSNSYTITVRLFNNLAGIKHAYVVSNRFAAEKIQLENEVPNE
jgi:rod shape-determining protein MreC